MIPFLKITPISARMIWNSMPIYKSWQVPEWSDHSYWYYHKQLYECELNRRKWINRLVKGRLG